LRRWTRLAPTYILVSAFIVGYNYFQVGTYLGLEFTSLSSVIIVIFSHVFLLGQDLLYFVIYDKSLQHFVFALDAENYMNVTGPLVSGCLYEAIPVGWSIGVEAAFYLLAPFLLTRKPILIIIMFPVFYYINQWLKLNLSGPWANRH